MTNSDADACPGEPTRGDPLQSGIHCVPAVRLRSQNGSVRRERVEREAALFFLGLKDVRDAPRDWWRVVERACWDSSFDDQDYKSLKQDVALEFLRPEVNARIVEASSPLAYAINIAGKKRSSFRRKRNYYRRLMTPLVELGIVSPPCMHWQSDPERTTQVRQEGQLVLQALDRLSAVKRDAYRLMVLQGLTAEQAGLVMGTSGSTAAGRKNSAETKIRRHLEKSAKNEEWARNED